MQTLEQLWTMARVYGKVTLATMDSGLYWCYIEFNTIDHVKLQAKSPSDCHTPHEALTEAIETAKLILDSLEQTINQLKRISS